MNRFSAVAACLLLAAGTAPVARAAGPLDALVKKLEANAALWVKDEPVDPAVDAELARLKFDKDSAAALQRILRSSRRDAVGLYVINNLLGRLLASDEETIRTVLPDVKAIQGRMRSAYRPFPTISRTQEAALKLPPYSGRMSATTIMARLAAIEQLRQTKIDRELAIAKHNEMVGKLSENTYRLICRAGDPREDATLVRTMLLEERAGRIGFIQIASAFGEVAGKMRPDRAKKLYAALRSHAVRMTMLPRKKYTDYGKPNLRRDGTSGFDGRDEYPGRLLLNTLNKIAAAAKDPSCPKVKVPDTKEIDEYNKRRR